MGCAKTRSGPPRPFHEVHALASDYPLYSCLELPPKYHRQECKKAGHCLCTDFLVEDPGEAFICGKDIVSCMSCCYVADFLCDYPMGKGKTCDAPLCEDHAMRPGPLVHPLDDLTAHRMPEEATKHRRKAEVIEDMHFCPAHWALSQKLPHPGRPTPQ